MSERPHPCSKRLQRNTLQTTPYTTAHIEKGRGSKKNSRVINRWLQP